MSTSLFLFTAMLGKARNTLLVGSSMRPRWVMAPVELICHHWMALRVGLLAGRNTVCAPHSDPLRSTTRCMRASLV